MSLREDVELYTKLSGEDGSQETIATIGAYLRGYRQGKEDAELHWIPVTERLPDLGIDGEIEILGYEQLAIADSTFKISNPVLATRKIDDRYELAVLQWEVDGNDRKYWVNDGGDIIKGVIAWMPLPEPFKGVTE